MGHYKVALPLLENKYSVQYKSQWVSNNLVLSVVKDVRRPYADELL